VHRSKAYVRATRALKKKWIKSYNRRNHKVLAAVAAFDERHPAP
jgi:hypothetical protein